MTIMSPDSGGTKRSELLRHSVEDVRIRPVGFAFMEKHRSEVKVSDDLLAGEVDGRNFRIIDKMINR